MRFDKVKAELEERGAQVLAMRCDMYGTQMKASAADATMQRFGAVAFGV